MLLKQENLKKLNLMLIAISYVGCFLYGLVGTARGSIYPDLLQTFHLSNTEGAMFFALASATGLLNNILTYKWYPLLGPIRALNLFLVLFAAGAVMVAFAPSFEVVLLGAAVIGFSMAGNGLLINILAAQSTKDSTLRRQVLSGVHAAYGLSCMLAPLCVNALSSVGLDWRMIFFIMGLTPLAATALSLRSDATGETSLEWKRAFVEHKPWRRTIWYAATCSCYVAVETLLGTRLALYARSELNFEMESANFLLSAFFMMFFMGRILFTVLKFKASNPHILMGSAALSLVAFLAGLYFHPWGFAVCGLGCSVFYPCMMAMLTDELGPATAFAMTWCQTAQSVGGIAMHALVGFLTDEIGLSRAMLIGPVCFALVILFLLTGAPKNRLFPRENEPQSI